MASTTPGNAPRAGLEDEDLSAGGLDERAGGAVAHEAVEAEDDATDRLGEHEG